MSVAAARCVRGALSEGEQRCLKRYRRLGRLSPETELALRRAAGRAGGSRRFSRKARQGAASSVRLIEHELADETEHLFGLLNREHVPGVGKSHEPQAVGWKRSSQLFGILVCHDRIELPCEQ